jgi:hypothetical protein
MENCGSALPGKYVIQELPACHSLYRRVARSMYVFDPEPACHSAARAHLITIKSFV